MAQVFSTCASPYLHMAQVFSTCAACMPVTYDALYLVPFKCNHLLSFIKLHSARYRNIWFCCAGLISTSGKQLIYRGLDVICK